MIGVALGSLVGLDWPVERIDTCRKLVRIKTHCMQGSLQRGLLLLQIQEVFLCYHGQPIEASVPFMLDGRVQVPCNSSSPCMLDVKLQGVLLASLGILGVTCVDMQESLDGQWRSTQPFRHLLIDACGRLEMLDFAHPWSPCW